MNKWTSVTERLPEKGKMVLATVKGFSRDHVVLAEYAEVNGTGIWYDHASIAVTVTAWMPLPEPYKGE